MLEENYGRGCMQLDKYTLVLASQSPRRKELLGWIDIPFIIKSEDIEEISAEHGVSQFNLKKYFKKCKELGFYWHNNKGERIETKNETRTQKQKQTHQKRLRGWKAICALKSFFMMNKI